MQRPTDRVQPLQVYQMAFQGSVVVARWAQPFLETSEIYLIQQFLATSQAVCAHLADAWGQRQHQESFIAALSTAQLQAAEMQTWIEAAIAAGYLAPDAGQDLYDHYRSLYIALDQLMAITSTATISLKENAETALPAIA